MKINQDAVHNWLVKLKKKVTGVLPRRSHIGEGPIYRLFGSTLFKKELWSFKAESLARGLALGLFVAFTPTIGFQMLIVCALILFFPGNLPIALAACWLTNPFTAPVIYFFEYKLGKWLMEKAGSVVYDPIGSVGASAGVFNMAEAMWMGSLVMGVAAGLCGYLLTYGLVMLERRLRMVKIVRERSSRKSKGSGARVDAADRQAPETGVDKTVAAGGSEEKGPG